MIALVQKIQNELSKLKFCGLMTIGSIEHISGDINPDFEKLVECRRQLCHELNLPLESVELSMGMSSDYELAVIYFYLFIFN